MIERVPNLPRPHTDENRCLSPPLPVRVGVWELLGSVEWGAGMLKRAKGFFFDANQFSPGEKRGETLLEFC